MWAAPTPTMLILSNQDGVPVRNRPYQLCTLVWLSVAEKGGRVLLDKCSIRLRPRTCCQDFTFAKVTSNGKHANITVSPQIFHLREAVEVQTIALSFDEKNMFSDPLHLNLTRKVATSFRSHWSI